MAEKERTEYLEKIKKLEKELVDLEIEFTKEMKDIPKSINFSILDAWNISENSNEALGIALRNLDKLSDIYERNRVLKENILDKCESIEKDTLDVLIYEKYLNYNIENRSINLELAFLKLHL